MGALPKRKYSKARQGRRRVNLKVAAEPAVGTCEQCGSPKRTHRVCPTCGTYHGRDVVEIKSPANKTA